jgi:hypothetical protein
VISTTKHQPSKKATRLLLTASAVVFVGGTVVGAKLAFSPPDGSVTDNAACTVHKISKGQPVKASAVTVNVFNASNRGGLATQIRRELEARGFTVDQSANNPTQNHPKSVMILANDPSDPVVQLVAAQFAGATIEYGHEDSSLSRGVSIIVGADYPGIGSAVTELAASQSTTVCIPAIKLTS